MGIQSGGAHKREEVWTKQGGRTGGSSSVAAPFGEAPGGREVSRGIDR